MTLKTVLFTIGLSILITYFGLTAVNRYAYESEDLSLQRILRRQEEEEFSIKEFNDSDYRRPPRFCIFNCVPAPDHRQCRKKCSSWEGETGYMIVGSSATTEGLCYCFYHGV
ncbi:MAG: hypothetical protein ACOCRX_03365 [Candidatus Woesearchaeota archaeon]